MPTRSLAAALLATLALSACSADGTTPTAALRPAGVAASALPGGTVVVSDEDVSRQAEDTPPLASWVLYTRGAGTGTFRTGPLSPPLGIGSVELATPTAADKVTLFDFEQQGTRLADIRAMRYATYKSGGLAYQVAALNIQVDANGDAPGGFTTLVFEPAYNTTQGAIIPDRWQPWDAFAGGQAVWWSSNPINGAPDRDTFVSWSAIVAQNPDAVIVGGYGVNQGSGNPALVTAVDDLQLDTTAGSVTWDFEPFRSVSSSGDCKDGGWKTLRRRDGSTFRNQGECVSYGQR